LILDLFIVLVGISLVCVGIGVFSVNKVFAAVGLGLLFLLGVVLVTNTLQVQTGVLIVQNGTNLLVQNQYAYFADTNSHWFGYLLSVLAFGGFCIIMFGLYGEWVGGRTE
jgi:hypothetical protein